MEIYVYIHILVTSAPAILDTLVRCQQNGSIINNGTIQVNNATTIIRMSSTLGVFNGTGIFTNNSIEYNQRKLKNIKSTPIM